MVEMSLRRGTHKEILAPIPSYITKELKLENTQKIDIKMIGKKIVITPCKKNDIKEGDRIKVWIEKVKEE